MAVEQVFLHLFRLISKFCSNFMLIHPSHTLSNVLQMPIKIAFEENANVTFKMSLFT